MILLCTIKLLITHPIRWLMVLCSPLSLSHGKHPSEWLGMLSTTHSRQGEIVLPLSTRLTLCMLVSPHVSRTEMSNDVVGKCRMACSCQLAAKWPKTSLVSLMMRTCWIEYLSRYGKAVSHFHFIHEFALPDCPESSPIRGSCYGDA